MASADEDRENVTDNNDNGVPEVPSDQTPSDDTVPMHTRATADDGEPAGDATVDEVDEAPVEDAPVDEAAADTPAEYVSPRAWSEASSTPADADADADTVLVGATAATAATAAGASTASAAAEPVYEWATEPEAKQKKRKRRWPWIVVPLAGVLAGVVVASLNLIAPGVSAAGVPVGGLTPEAAEKQITERLADAKITIKTDAGDITLSGEDLGATIDAKAIAQATFDKAPAWKVGEWGTTQNAASITVDEDKAYAALQEAFPGSFIDPVDAKVTLDPATGQYVVTPAVDGKGLHVDALSEGLEKAMASETDSTTIQATADPISPKLSTNAAEAGVASINKLTSDVGFFVGEEKTVPVDQATAASWVSPEFNGDGTVKIVVDKAKVAEFTKSLAAKVDRPAEDGVWLVDREGDQLLDQNYTKQGVQGRTIGDVSKIADDFAKQLEQGNGHYPLTVTTVEPKITKLERWIEVNLSEQTVYVYENGQVIRTMLTSSGLSPNDSHTGTFRINSHVVEQNMGSCDANGDPIPGGEYDYCTANVKWVMYYNGDEAFHGTWWHAEFGRPMSHGCMNLSEENAKWLWDWTPLGTEVWVHY